MSLSCLARVCSRAGKISHYTSGIRLLSVQQPSNAQILLVDVPDLTTPGDIKRAIAGKLQGVERVELDYHRFEPTGRAIITLTRPEFLQNNLRALERFTIFGLPVKVRPRNTQEPKLPRTRGAQGRAEATARGVITGTGPKGNFPNTERNVVIWGLPGKLTPKDLETTLGDFKLARSQNGQATIIKLPLPDNQFSMFSRFVITMASVSEARRLVRSTHMRRWPFGGTQLVRAQALF